MRQVAADSPIVLLVRCGGVCLAIAGAANYVYFKMNTEVLLSMASLGANRTKISAGDATRVRQHSEAAHHYARVTLLIGVAAAVVSFLPVHPAVAAAGLLIALVSMLSLHGHQWREQDDGLALVRRAGLLQYVPMPPTSNRAVGQP